jgi:hypothetical protein
MTNPVKFWRLISLAGAAGTTLLGSGDARAEFVVGAIQQSGTTYFTQVVTTFNVPNPPTSGSSQAVVSMWPGLQTSNQDLIQPVLEYAYENAPGWTMHNEVAPGNNKVAAINDTAGDVKAGDEIYAQVWFDQNNPGSNCKPATGANCNYSSMWWDLTSGSYEFMSRDWTVAEGPTFAMGMVFETAGGVYNSCADFPVGGVKFNMAVYQWSSSNVYTSVTPNFAEETPASSIYFQFTNQGLNNGGNAYPNCVNITYPLSSGSTGMLWLNAY